jgi:hypothetical protein
MKRALLRVVPSRHSGMIVSLQRVAGKAEEDVLTDRAS